MKKTLASALRALACKLDPPRGSYFAKGAAPEFTLKVYEVPTSDATAVANAVSWSLRTGR